MSDIDVRGQSDEQLHTEKDRLVAALAFRTSGDWEADRRKLRTVIGELESRGYTVD
ncbi:hypothetical protein L3Q65_00930 (plasmid) [Amycolatopsis sp. FU40]|uniref:hypothetical protein n=1 Tax=Amycolatopsis sp. FU40 TaxID=2914159 RepID=UPI001F36AE9E|nr:hypothetical protein [Amycolatopsis sp. FU40]UKD50889.1 hypothetical protein L3Q65_00930 [Amycolatopsis sp. FU40]